MELSIMELGAICMDTEKTIQYLKDNKMLAQELLCDSCDFPMSWQRETKTKVDLFGDV